MNKIIIIITILCLSLIASSAQVNYVIKGTANGMNGRPVYLYAAEGNETVIDSTFITNNAFNFKGSQSKACFANISLGHHEMTITIILENGTINVSLNYPKKISGLYNDILYACKEKIDNVDSKCYAINKQLRKLTKADQKNEWAALQKKLEKLSNKRISIIKSCLNQNLDNIVGAYLLHTYESSFSSEEIIKILENASPIMKENGFTKEVIEHQEAIKHSEIGQKYTDCKLEDPDGKEFALSDYIGKGKYVLIDFWASWCGPCRIEIPNVKAAYEKFKSKGFEVVGISLDHKKEDWLKGIKDLCITWPQMSDLKGWKCSAAKLYAIRSIPSTLLIDPNGIIIAKGLRGEEIEKKLSELLN